MRRPNPGRRLLPTTKELVSPAQRHHGWFNYKAALLRSSRSPRPRSLNGDGYSDVVVSAYTYTDGQTQEGRVFVYMGSASGLEVN